MPVIITATDFSEVAENAIHYACDMAVAHNYSVTIVHSYIVPVGIIDTPMPVMPVNEAKEIADESMQHLVNKLRTLYPTLDLNSHIAYGEITDSLQEYVKETKPWMVVIGNSADEDTPFWLGSNLLSEMKHLPCKVLAVPQQTKFTPVKKICLACDMKNILDQLPAEEMIDIVKQTGASLHVLNVDHNNKQFGTETPLEASALHDLLHEANPEYHYIDNEDVEEGIKSFTELNNIDWLVVTPHKHSFFERLFQKSHTKEIVKKVNIPIVSLHER